MEENELLKFLKDVQDDLMAKLDVLVLDAGVLVYDLTGKIYEDFDEVKKDINTGKITVFVSFDALVGDETWSKVDETCNS